MGGGQTLRVVTTHPDQFAYVAIWSAGISAGTPRDFEKRNAAFLENADKVNKLVKLLSISVGDKDFALAGSKALSELLKKHGIKHELHVSGGGHTWINWRHYLNELRPEAVPLSRPRSGRGGLPPPRRHDRPVRTTSR